MPPALPAFLGSMQGEDLSEEKEVEEEQQLQGPEQGGTTEEMATCSSQDQAMMQDCYSKIVEKLSVANPTMVLQVHWNTNCLESTKKTGLSDVKSIPSQCLKLGT